MKKAFAYLMSIGAALIMFACEKQSIVGNAEAESLLLEKLYQEIDSLAALHACEDRGEWRFTAIGEKACGGPAGYIAYAAESDTAAFLNKVATYTTFQRTYNKKWNVVSDCMFVVAPNRVVCEDGKPKLVWDDQLMGK
ncbi:hypothetical protein GCM10007415_06630 [Parapedobacter pyrenivorans]|uniref:Lipoprotein n=1 Tax=Parapedobacter pyrenivorans TaxID=1305674 RepID=A0A917HGK2_9SPHI|nr:hypothetical protein [Parapedobacter pyrenivorans]GGG77381.1 hypothetical protein GCM10007415_06630 [Parapedobacter pyrenivorans]